MREAETPTLTAVVGDGWGKREREGPFGPDAAAIGLSGSKTKKDMQNNF